MNYLNRVIRNPRYVLSKNFLLHPKTSLNTARRLIKNNKPILESAAALTNENIDTLKSFLEDIKKNYDLQKHLDDQYLKLSRLISSETDKLYFAKNNPGGRLNRNAQEHAGFLLYILVRALKPNTFVETGVSGGESSSYILQAMNDNNKGHLYSIDLPPDFDQKARNVVIPNGETSGWAIPTHLKKSWTLKLGSSKDLLNPLLQNLKEIDMFCHDSLHTYDHMLFEYETSWQYLKKNGIIITDDVATMNKLGHSPLLDFVDAHNENFIVCGMIGGLKKSK